MLPQNRRFAPQHLLVWAGAIFVLVGLVLGADSSPNKQQAIGKSSESKEKSNDRLNGIAGSGSQTVMRRSKKGGKVILSSMDGHDDQHLKKPLVMPFMAHHYNPFVYYPMLYHQHHDQAHHQQQPPMMMSLPIVIEDHSSLHGIEEEHHMQPEHHYQHHEQGHYEGHHEMPQLHEGDQHQQQHHHHEEIHLQHHHMPEHGHGHEHLQSYGHHEEGPQHHMPMVHQQEHHQHQEHQHQQHHEHHEPQHDHEQQQHHYGEPHNKHKPLNHEKHLELPPYHDPGLPHSPQLPIMGEFHLNPEQDPLSLMMAISEQAQRQHDNMPAHKVVAVPQHHQQHQPEMAHHEHLEEHGSNQMASRPLLVPAGGGIEFEGADPAAAAALLGRLQGTSPEHLAALVAAAAAAPPTPAPTQAPATSTPAPKKRAGPLARLIGPLFKRGQKNAEAAKEIVAATSTKQKSRPTEVELVALPFAGSPQLQ